jgi:hypothetical protein
MLTASLVSVAALSATPAMTGCRATEGAFVVVETSPPPPRREVVVYRPGFLWIPGRWVHAGNRWDWRGGYYARERPNHVYVEGRWERRGRGHVWVEGGWRPRDHARVRDRRRSRDPERHR